MTEDAKSENPIFPQDGDTERKLSIGRLETF